MISKKICSLISLLLFVVLSNNNYCSAAPPIPVSVVDYMKSVKMNSSFDNRKELYLKKWPGENFTGTADQNTKLLKNLLNINKHILLPFPSNEVDKCEEFYTHEKVAKYMSKMFQKNAIAACIVTGTKTASKSIRMKLQEIYKNAKPENGETFTYKEHKKFHDQAYKAAGCVEDSAHIAGWFAVDFTSLDILPDDFHKKVIKLAIEKFGKCTITGTE